MAIEAKVSFMNQVEHALAEQVTVADMARVMLTVSDVLENFEMREYRRWEEDEPDDLLDAFLAAMNVQGLSEKTIWQYRYQIGRFKAFVGIHTRKVTVYHVRNYLASEKTRGVSDGSLNNIRSCLSAFFKWLHAEGLIQKNPIANIRPIKQEKKKKEVYTETDLTNLDEYADSLRDRAIIHFLKSTGCRISEMVGLNRDQIDFSQRECIVYGKGRKERPVYMDEVTALMVKRYLMTRNDTNPALFTGCRGERLHDGGVRYMLKKVEKLARVHHVHPHKFRRTLATDLHRKGMPIQDIAAILGHEKIDTTMEYIVINQDDVRQSYRKFA